MGWSKKQKSAAAQACRAAGMREEHRRLVLRQFNAAFYDAEGRQVDQPTSTSKRLTNADYEQFMAVIERTAGGKLPGYSRLYWRRKADDYLHRMRYRARELAAALGERGVFDDPETALAGWIQKRVAQGERKQLEELDYHGMRALLTGMGNYARRHGVRGV